jgi:hypothetical protein
MSVSPTFTKVFLVTASLVVLGSAVLLDAQSRANDRNRNTIPVIVSPYGFQYTDLTVSAGSYLFVLINRTGFGEISVYLERVTGNSVTDDSTQLEFGHAVGDKRRLLRNANLARGAYRLRVENRPAWILAIHVN